MSLATLIQVVEATQDAEKRIPPELRGKITFFSDYDLWEYHAVFDERLCDACSILADVGFFLGIHLRKYFPYLEIMDENRINCEVHPNCRCWLSRLGFILW